MDSRIAIGGNAIGLIIFVLASLAVGCKESLLFLPLIGTLIVLFTNILFFWKEGVRGWKAIHFVGLIVLGIILQMGAGFTCIGGGEGFNPQLVTPFLGFIFILLGILGLLAKGLVTVLKKFQK